MLLLFACGPSTKSDTSEVVESQTPAIEEQASDAVSEESVLAGFTLREPTDDEINEFGVIEELEDAGYPMFNLTVAFPERQTSSNFSLNAEIASLSHDINAYRDQYATIYYESNESTEVLDILLGGNSLLGEYAPEDHEGLTRFDGVLSGADRVSGDLPSKIQIEGEEGALTFEYYVDAATVAANGKAVTAYYYQRYVDTITYMALSED